ncbi:MAG: WG repeat-containing protein [Bacteroidales bacterium]|nr:WG repeat-containing protein [Bacteroidales bacterium]
MEGAMTMKRLMLVWVMILCLVLLGARAEEENASALYPIRESGLWGYMNRAGDVVIEPHWDWAGDFSGPVAIVAENGDDRQAVYGVINTDGEFVVPAMYAQIEDYGDFLIIFEVGDNPDGDLVGWYDKSSGYFQEPVYQEIDDTPTDSDLILVTLSIDGEQGDLVIHSAYCRRDTGEIAFLFDYVGEPYTLGTFHKGYAYWLIENADGFDAFLLNTDGARVTFPSGIRPVSDVCDGVLRIANDEDLVGLARPDGTIVLPPTYDWIENPSEGRIFFEQGDRLGVMDLEGNEILSATFEWDPGWNVYGGGEEHFYHNGYALVVLCDDENVRSYVFLNRDGKVVFSAPVCPDENTTISPLVYVMEGGRAWIRKTEKQADSTVKVSHSLVRLTEEGSEDLTGFVFDKTTSADDNIPDFHEGLLPVCLNGLWGYIWESGGWAYPLVPAYDRAEPFHNGLAMVEKNGKLGYIDYDGVVIWQEDPVQEIIPVFIGDEATSMQAVLHNGPIEDAYALIPLPQVLEALGYPLSWESETLATFDWDGERYVVDTAAAALYPEGKDPERWNCLEPAPGNAGHTVWTVNTGADFIIDSSFCKLVLMDMGYIDWVEPEDMRVRIVPLRPNQMPAD